MTPAEIRAYIETLGLDRLAPDPDPDPEPVVKEFDQALVDQVIDLIAAGHNDIYIQKATRNGGGQCLTKDQIQWARARIAERIEELTEEE